MTNMTNKQALAILKDCLEKKLIETSLKKAMEIAVAELEKTVENQDLERE